MQVNSKMVEPKLEGFVKRIETCTYSMVIGKKYIAVQKTWKHIIFKQKWFIENVDDDPEIQ